MNKQLSERQWLAIKGDIERRKMSCKQITEKHKIGEKRYYIVRKSASYSQYRQILSEINKKRVAQRELQKVVNSASYDRPYTPTGNGQKPLWLRILAALIAVLMAGMIVVASMNGGVEW